MEDTSRKANLKSRLENIWYYYKWLIICVGLLVLFLIVALVQALSARKPDVDFLYIGSGVLTVKDSSELKEFVGGFTDDINGDGVTEIGYLELTAHTDNADTFEGEEILNYDVNNAVLQRFESEVRAGDTVIFLIDDYYYSRIKETGVLAPLADLFDSDALPPRLYDEYGVYLKDLALSTAPGFKHLPDSTILCIRRSPDKDVITYGRTPEEWTANMLCFTELLTWRADSVVFSDINVNISYFGDGKIADEGLYYFKRFLAKNIVNTADYGDTRFNYSQIPTPIIVPGDESQEALTERELYADFVSALTDETCSVLLIDEKYIPLALEYGSFVPIAQAAGEIALPVREPKDEAASKLLEIGVFLEDLDCYSLPGLRELPTGVVICVESLDGKADSSALLALSTLLGYEKSE